MLRSIPGAPELCVALLASHSCRLSSTAKSTSSSARRSPNIAEVGLEMYLALFPALLALLQEWLASWVMLCCVPHLPSLPFHCFAGSHLSLLLSSSPSEVYFCLAAFEIIILSLPPSPPSFPFVFL